MSSVSFSSLGSNYEVKSQNQAQNRALLAGAEKFGVEELEVFLIQNIPGANLDLANKS